MREMIFREKRIDNGEWVEGYYGEYYNGKKNISCISIPSKEAVSGSLCYDIIPETVGQYTGLTDKNGKKLLNTTLFILQYVELTTIMLFHMTKKMRDLLLEIQALPFGVISVQKLKS